jgi:hypothetical protein
MDAIQSEVHDRRRRWTWEFSKERRDDRKRYVGLCKRRESVPPSPSVSSIIRWRVASNPFLRQSQRIKPSSRPWNATYRMRVYRAIGCWTKDTTGSTSKTSASPEARRVIVGLGPLGYSATTASKDKELGSDSATDKQRQEPLCGHRLRRGR